MTISPFRLALILLIAGLLTWCAFDYQGDQLDTTRSELASVQTELANQRETARLAAEQLAARDALDTQHTQELNRVQTENRALQLDVADGRRRLRIKAICPAMPGSAGTAGLADGGSTELAADARPDYFTLRDQLALSRQQILGLQDYIRRVVFGTSATEKTLKRMETTQ